jgi:hypothetical protein
MATITVLADISTAPTAGDNRMQAIIVVIEK